MPLRRVLFPLVRSVRLVVVPVDREEVPEDRDVLLPVVRVFRPEEVPEEVVPVDRALALSTTVFTFGAEEETPEEEDVCPPFFFRSLSSR